MLAVVVDGVALPEDEGRAMWNRFSAWMEEHRGDLAGFAQQEGFVSIHPGVANGKPVLLASKSTIQKPYAAVREDTGSGSMPRDSSGGSKPRQSVPNDQKRHPQNTQKPGKKRNSR